MSLIFMAATEQLELTADYPRTIIFHPGLICSLSVAYLVYQLYCLWLSEVLYLPTQSVCIPSSKMPVLEESKENFPCVCV